MDCASDVSPETDRYYVTFGAKNHLSFVIYLVSAWLFKWCSMWNSPYCQLAWHFIFHLKIKQRIRIFEKQTMLKRLHSSVLRLYSQMIYIVTNEQKVVFVPILLNDSVPMQLVWFHICFWYIAMLEFAVFWCVSVEFRPFYGA